MVIKIISFVASLVIRGLVLGLVGFMGVLGFIMLAPFPSFWRELTERGSGYASKKA